MATFGFSWLCLATFCYFWFFLATFCYFWLLFANFDYNWLLLATLGFFWLILACLAVCFCQFLSIKMKISVPSCPKCYWIVLYITRFVLNMTGLVQNITKMVLNMIGFNFFFQPYGSGTTRSPGPVLIVSSSLFLSFFCNCPLHCWCKTFFVSFSYFKTTFNTNY